MPDSGTEPIGRQPALTPGRCWTGFVLFYAGLAVFFAAYAATELRRHPAGPAQIAAIYVCFLLLLAFYLAPGFSFLRIWMVERMRGIRAAFVCLAVFLVPYLVYAAGTGDFRVRAFAELLALAAVPFGLFAAFPVRRPRRKRRTEAGGSDVERE